MFHGNTEAIIETLLETGITLAVGAIIIKILLVLEKRGLKRSKIDEALYLFIQRVTKVVLWIALIIMVMQSFGFKTSSLIAMLGAAGAAVALALKDSLGNVAGGIIILFTHPFRKGDYIEIRGQNIEGAVDSIDLLTSCIHTVDNKLLIVPNGTITTNAVVNYTIEKTRRVDFTVGVSYDADIEEVKKKLIEVAEADDRILKDPAPFTGIAELSNSTVNVVLKVWTATENYWDVDYSLKENVFNEFNKAGIEIPFDQLDVNISK